ncbi:F-box/kelch-repeat protein [Vitis vinifera]|uniref:F-box/kelch-repeat protein n=1 Tax=Vitis vinifera TaxID=29760 RepID=A0A438EF67_VITVI|nr:F-box/kelch-repeat protein [Vitis vinifera]
MTISSPTTPMGFLPSPPRTTTPPPSPENTSSRYRVMASFCLREPAPNANVSNWIECYNPCDNTWTYVNPVPGLADNQVLKGFAMVSLGDSIFIIGGRLCRKDRARGEEFIEVDVEVLSTVLRYNVTTTQWSKCTPLGTPRYDFACTVCENKIYVAGGKSTLESARGISLAEAFDPALNVWTPLPNMSTLRYKCVGVTWQGKILVVGGFADRLDSDRTVPYALERSSAELFDPSSGRWDLMVGMWQLDVPPNQIVVVDGNLFSSGDCLKAWKGHIEAYDMNLNIWNIVDGSQLQTLCSPLYLTVAPLGTLLYFLAGYRRGAGGSSNFISMVHVFDTLADEDAWRDLEPIQEVGDKELCSHGCVVQLSK